MKLVASGYKWDGQQGNLQATVTLLAEDSTPLFEDSVSLSKQASRHRFAQTVLRRFPELKGKDIESQLLQLLWQAKGQQEKAESKETQKRGSQADILVSLVDDCFLFHYKGKPYARLNQGGHREVWPSRSRNFKTWLSLRFWQREEKTPGNDALSAALNVIEGKALLQGEQMELFNRVAMVGNTLWYDLSDPEWRAVRIDPGNWSIVDEPQVFFRRYAHQLPQVEPATPGDITSVLKYVNLNDESARLLFLVYLVTCFIPDIPHPILHPYGDKGAGKSCLQKVVRLIVDPSAVELLSFPKDITELSQKLDHNWVAFFDNVSNLQDWQSDTLCRACTGQGFSKRELYSDDDDIIYSFRRIVGMNGINAVAARADLLDRTILLKMDMIPGEFRRDEGRFWSELDKDKPQILGGIFAVLSKALMLRPQVKLASLPRMADFTLWGCAIAETMGYNRAQFLDAYLANIQVQSQEAVRASLIGQTIMDFMIDKAEWRGTASDLLTELEAVAESKKINTRVKGWPKAPNSLTRRLNEIKSSLKDLGIDIDVEHTREGAMVTITPPKSKENTVTTITSSQQIGPQIGERCDDIEADIVTRGAISSQNTRQRDGNIVTQENIVTNAFYLSQIRRDGCDDSDDISPTLTGAQRDIIQYLGMTTEKVLAIWDKQGKPVIHLGPSENCHDLAKLLEQGDIKSEHLSAIREWLEKYGSK